MILDQQWFLSYIPREAETYDHTKTFTCTLIAALFVSAKNGNNPNTYKLMNESKRNMIYPHNGKSFYNKKE